MRGFSEAERGHDQQGPDGLRCKLAPFNSKPGCILSDHLAFNSRRRSLSVEHGCELDLHIRKQTDRQRGHHKRAADADVADASASYYPATGPEVNRPADLVPISPTVFHDASMRGELEFNQRTRAAFVLSRVCLECCCATATNAMPERFQSCLTQRGQLRTDPRTNLKLSRICALKNSPLLKLSCSAANVSGGTSS
jgi:hypothetical protein